METIKHMQEVCKKCPFSREVHPGALGGSTPETYLGQAAGPFVLPCHLHCDFDDPGWKTKIIDIPQCAGAAIFRTHINVASHMPAAIHRLPANPAKVFVSSAEFLAHHKGIGLSDAVVMLKLKPPHILMQEQLERRSNIIFSKE